MNHFTDQVCIVSGGTQGLGWAIVQALASRGAEVFACGYSRQNLQQAVRQLGAMPWGQHIHLSQCDVSDDAEWEAWIRCVYQQTGRIDLLVNNAAFVRWIDVAQMSVDDALQTMRVSYDGMVVGVKTVLPLMESAGQGHIVNIGSMTAHIYVPGASAAYAAAKAAVDAYTLMLQIELSRSPVCATLVRLATIAGTDFFKTHVKPARMSPLTRYIPALTPPVVADAILRAIERKQPILTLPRYMAVLGVIYRLAPRFSRWLSRLGGQNDQDYGGVRWEYRRDS